MSAITTLKALPLPEKLQLIEDLWNSITSDQLALADHPQVVEKVPLHRARFEEIENLKLFNGLLKKVPVGIYIVCIREGMRMKFEYVSDKWCEIHQTKREDALADISIVHQMIHKDDIDNFLKLNEDVASSKKNFLWEGRFVIDGKVLWFRIESAPFNYANEDYRWYGVVQDITESKLTELAIRQSEAELRELNTQKDKFFSIISHDLRTPFNGILGMSELLLEQINQRDYTGIDVYATHIQKSSKIAFDLLNNLLEWARSETGKLIYTPKLFNLINLIDENIANLKINCDEKNTTIAKDMTDVIHVFADKQMINTVFRNLISNAIKYTHNGGEIRIAVEQTEREIIISVADNGVGIESERIQDFFRIDKNTSTPGTNNEEGTGLGLILCKEFVGKHNGKIWVESMRGRGSVFYFTLPNQIDNTLAQPVD